MVVRALIFRSSRTRFLLCHFLLFVPSHSYQPFPRSLSCHFPISQPHSLSSQTPPASTPLPPAPPTSTEDVNEICRILSDFRAPHHDIELALTPYSSALSTNLVEQVLKRTKNLGFSAHRFFFWARRFPGFRPSIANYKILINILGSSKQFPLIWDLLSEMREGESLKLCPDVFWVIFGWYCRADLPNDAIRAFHRMADFGVRPSLNDLDHLLYALCKRGFVRNAQEFFDKVKFQFKPGVKTYSILMRGWGNIADSGSACKLFDEMLEKGCVADVPAYNSLLEALCRGGNVEEAYRFFREMGCKGLDPDACTYSIFIRAYCEGDNIYSAFRVLDRMRKYNLLPNVYTYNSVIKKLCMDEKVEEAYLLLDEMVKQGVNPDTWSYNAIQAFHCERCEVNRALGLISRMESANCMPDRHTYNMLLKMLIKVGRFDKVAGVWDGMEARGFYPSVSTYAVMIHGFLKKKGKVEEACKYFEVMIDEGIPPYTSTCELLRNRLLGLGLLEQIDILVNKMKQSTSCSIQELSKTLRGDSSHRSSRREETSGSSDDEWVWGSPNNLTT
ncbi:hypothetical protein Nepgr_017771 [Nepenthes gracilis]|uniref:PROP1-like PPR domain-containing protein n=1 Tax=Nepenthes gracilis TaxID=150966 RepID=A0AAD3XTQ1_NEPGR|nr:hypothetical protein Nepgr_017771 [Nepenthes gracilis]